VPPCLNLLTKKAPYKGLGADSEEKHEPATDIDTVAVDSLKALDPNGPIREADIRRAPTELLLEIETPNACPVASLTMKHGLLFSSAIQGGGKRRAVGMGARIGAWALRPVPLANRQRC